jgi:hypothetical protein
MNFLRLLVILSIMLGMACSKNDKPSSPTITNSGTLIGKWVGFFPNPPPNPYYATGTLIWDFIDDSILIELGGRTYLDLCKKTFITSKNRNSYSLKDNSIQIVDSSGSGLTSSLSFTSDTSFIIGAGNIPVYFHKVRVIPDTTSSLSDPIDTLKIIGTWLIANADSFRLGNSNGFIWLTPACTLKVLPNDSLYWFAYCDTTSLRPSEPRYFSSSYTMKTDSAWLVLNNPSLCIAETLTYFLKMDSLSIYGFTYGSSYQSLFYRQDGKQYCE